MGLEVCLMLNSTDSDLISRNLHKRKSWVSTWSLKRFNPGPAEPEYIITKTYLYNFDPLKPNFYIVKLGFTGVYIIFLISAQKHRLWVLVRTASPRRF